MVTWGPQGPTAASEPAGAPEQLVILKCKPAGKIEDRKFIVTELLDELRIERRRAALAGRRV